MTDIDPKSDIELHTANEHVIVRVPLAGPVTDEWLRRYQRLAHATGVPVQAQAHPDRTWIVVSVRADGNQREISATMDAARALIAEADAVNERPPRRRRKALSVTGGPAGGKAPPAGPYPRSLSCGPG